ncbi:aspartate/tyrosine/aromatic aminotransferase [Kingella negevensis]|uniref:amino acid aminotransferase n=1 Tax=Kingella negevensis TaxID=1522312 RepID=UPI0025432122|nr:amino acid aminotransferase [Kingella negevensis]WII93118.1 aspartate/tyrosine/aromatic aminotransferase [Kingella negevensis]
MFEHLTPYAGDPILSLVETFNADPRPHKVNLCIGIYFDNDGKMAQPYSVHIAEERVGMGIKNYLPMEGHAGLRAEIPKLLFGTNHPVITENRVSVVQTLGGSGALRLGADFLHTWLSGGKAYVSDPTWDNHRGIFTAAGFEVGDYPYYNPETIGVKFQELCEFAKSQPENTIFLLHPCCHNPTGVDLSREQWDELLDIFVSHKLIPFMDIAYQGFGDDFDQDAYAVRRAADLGLPLLISSSFSKNMSLYGQRTGGLTVVSPSAEEATLVLGQLQLGIRRIYSTPPAQGGLTAYHVLSNETLTAQWKQEVYKMRDRIRAMRQRIYEVLQQKQPEKDFSYFVKQRGMFSYTGLSVVQVHRLRDEFGVYLLDSGRICIAGLNESNVNYVADCLATVFAE